MTRRRGVAAWLDRHVPLIDDDHPEAVSRMDALDGVGETRTGMPHPRKDTDREAPDD